MFIFRDEPDEFLRFIVYFLSALEGRPEEQLYDFYMRALIEMEDRRRLKALRESLRALGY